MAMNRKFKGTKYQRGFFLSPYRFGPPIDYTEGIVGEYLMSDTQVVSPPVPNIVSTYLMDDVLDIGPPTPSVISTYLMNDVLIDEPPVAAALSIYLMDDTGP